MNRDNCEVTAITFGYEVINWLITDYYITSLSILNQSNTVLFAQANVFVEGDAGHSSFVFSGVSGQSQIIEARIDLGASSDNIGMDNILFSQSVSNQDNGPVPVPESATLLLLGAGPAGIGAARRRRFRLWTNVTNYVTYGPA